MFRNYGHHTGNAGCRHRGQEGNYDLLLLLPVIILKYRSIIIDLLIKDSNKIVNDTTKKDNVLASEQQAASVQADQILKDANDAKEKSDQETVTADWNVKK